MSSASDPRYSLVIPAYNEERRIGELFERILTFDGELVVVCDGNDRTADTVSRIAAARPDLVIRCLTFPERLGKGGGIRAGMQVAKAPAVGFFDADGSTSITEMERLFSLLSSADAVIGSRWMAGSDIEIRQDLLRRIASRGFNLIIRALFGLSFTDTQCGAKVFRKDALDTVLPGVIATGFEFDVELLWRLKRAGCTIVETPIVWGNRGDSRVRSTDMARMVAGLVRVRFGSGRGRRP